MNDDVSYTSYVFSMVKVHPLVGTSLHNMGVVDMYAKGYKKALHMFIASKIVRTSTLSLTSYHPSIVSSLSIIGLAQMATTTTIISMSSRQPTNNNNINNNLYYAYKSITKVLQLQRKLYGDNHESRLCSLKKMGSLTESL